MKDASTHIGMSNIRKIAAVAGALIGALLLAGMISAALAPAPAMADQNVPPGTTKGWQTFTFANSVGVTSAGGYTTSSPLTVAGTDASRAANWYLADVFITRLAGTGSLTITPQFSADATYWANDYYTVMSGTTPVDVSRVVYVSAAGTTFVQIPIKGAYMRFVMNSNAAAGITTTVKVVLKNNGGY